MHKYITNVLLKQITKHGVIYKKVYVYTMLTIPYIM